jgi:hypothetical protein
MLRDIVGIYIKPAEHALVLCVDEKDPSPGVGPLTTAPPMRPGQPERRMYDYKRHGTTSRFPALDVATGKAIANTARTISRPSSIESTPQPSPIMTGSTSSSKTQARSSRLIALMFLPSATANTMRER